VIQLRRLGRTDEQWFGPALGQIQKLRKAVNDYFESISMNPPRLDDDGDIVGLDPEGVVDVLEQAVNYILGTNIQGVLAVSELYLQKRYAELLDVLLPDNDKVPKSALEQYRADVITLLLDTDRENGEEENPDVAPGLESEESEDGGASA
jgi:hypothetical protein